MAPAALLILLTVGSLAAGVGGLSAPATATPAESLDPRTDAAPAENRTLLSADELYACTVVERDTTTAALYFVDENGSWYHATSGGTIGAAAPAGAAVPNLDGVTVDLPASERPGYVWKVTAHGCGTTVYNASNGEPIAGYPIPGCGVPGPTGSTSASASEAQSTEDGVVIRTARGFGGPAAVVALAVVAILLIRR